MGDLSRQPTGNAGPGGVWLPLGTSLAAASSTHPRGPAPEGPGAHASPFPGKFFSAPEGRQVGREKRGGCGYGCHRREPRASVWGLVIAVAWEPGPAGQHRPCSSFASQPAPAPQAPHAEPAGEERGRPQQRRAATAPSLPPAPTTSCWQLVKSCLSSKATFRMPRFGSLSDGGVGSPLL